MMRHVIKAWMRGVVGTDYVYVSYSGTRTMVPELSVAVILALRDIEGTCFGHY